MYMPIAAFARSLLVNYQSAKPLEPSAIEVTDALYVWNDTPLGIEHIRRLVGNQFSTTSSYGESTRS